MISRHNQILYLCVEVLNKNEYKIWKDHQIFVDVERYIICVNDEKLSLLMSQFVMEIKAFTEGNTNTKCLEAISSRSNFSNDSVSLVIFRSHSAILNKQSIYQDTGD